MTCRDFEQLLETYLAGRLESGRSESAERHLRDCTDCSDLLELARIAFEPTDPSAAEPPPDLIADVLRATAGSSCLAAERVLGDYVDRTLSDQRSALVEMHLAGCSDCRGLTGALVALRVDLPRLAEIQPDSRFVDAVLAATLPWHVRLRRWWQSHWPRWVERPRFAAEAAYISTLVLVLIFSTPGSPLEAMPRHAVELARRTAPTQAISDPWGRFEATVAPTLEALKNSEGTRAVYGSWRTTFELGTQAYGWTSGQIRTFWHRLASVLERAEETPSSADQDSDEEKS